MNKLILAILMAAVLTPAISEAQLFGRRRMFSRPHVTHYRSTPKYYHKVDNRDEFEAFAQTQIDKATEGKRYSDLIDSLGLNGYYQTQEQRAPFAQQGNTLYGYQSYQSGLSADQVAQFGQVDVQGIFRDASRLAEQSVQAGTTGTGQFIAMAQQMGAAAAAVAKIKAQGDVVAQALANVHVDAVQPAKYEAFMIKQQAATSAPTQIHAIISRCNLCHVERGKPLVSQHDSEDVLSAILTDDPEHRMPPADSTPLTWREKAEIVRWVNSK